MEPFQRLITPQPGFLEGVRAMTTRHGVPLVFDEIVTGFRFAYGGAQEYYGVVPDVVALGKVVGGGFPLSAVAGRRDIMRHLAPDLDGTPEFVAQAGTLNGNPIAAAAGLATLAELRKPGTYARLFATGTRLKDGLAAAARQRGPGRPGGGRAARVRDLLHGPTHHRLPREPLRRPRASRRVHAGDARARRGQGRGQVLRVPRAWRGRRRPHDRDLRRGARGGRGSRHPNRRGGLPMAESWQNEAWAKEFWYSGKATRRRLLGLGATAAGALGATMLVPAPWRERSGRRSLSRSARFSPCRARRRRAARPPSSACRWRSTASTSRAASTAGRSSCSSPTTSRSPTSAGARRRSSWSRTRSTPTPGGYLSNVCLACMPVYEEHKIVNMIRCASTPRSRTSQVQPLHLPPVRLRPGPGGGRSRPIWSTRWARSGTSPMPTTPGASRPSDAYADEIKKAGGEVVGTTGIPLGTADMTPFLSKITGELRRPLRHLLRQGRHHHRQPGFDLGLTKKYKWAGDGAIAVVHQPARARQQDRGLRRHRPVHPGPRWRRSTRRPTRSSSTTRWRA